MNYEKELAAALRTPELWFEQLCNVITTLLWGVGVWMMITGSIFGFFTGALLVSIDITSFSSTELLNVSVTIFKITGIFVAGLVALVGLPKRLKNVFRLHSQYRIDRYHQIKQSIEFDIDNTEALLLQYELIHKEDILRRKKQLKPGRLL